MIDCSQTEISAISEAFPEVNISLCHWHIKRAWETNIKKQVNVFANRTQKLKLTFKHCIQIKITNAKQETERAQAQIRVTLNNMMHATDEDSFQKDYQYFKKSFQDFPDFVNYFNNQWLPKSEKWCKAWRRVSRVKQSR